MLRMIILPRRARDKHRKVDPQKAVFCLQDMAADPKMADVIASITARVEAAAATGPPWAWPMEGNPLQTAEYENCQGTLETGFFEPALESWPPPGEGTVFIAPFYDLNTERLPRQARDEHRS
eukprot:COSAG06_NODE_4589_length_4122_cov_1.697241_5_plen_122_part_00